MADPAGEVGTAERVFITMPDGTRLATTLFLPAGEGPVPCVLEALPYRKDDLTATYRPEYVRLRDEHGYAIARLDVRGTGSSGGLATDEYPEQEQRDLCDVIAWLASSHGAPARWACTARRTPGSTPCRSRANGRLH